MNNRRPATQVGPTTMDGRPDMRYAINRQSAQTAQGVRVEAPKAKTEVTFNHTAGNITFYRNGTRLAGPYALSRAGSNVSCGVHEMFGVSALENAVTYGVPPSVLKDALDAVIKYHKRGCAFLIASNHNRSTNVNKALSELASYQSEWRRNPNSGNQIMVWTF